MTWYSANSTARLVFSGRSDGNLVIKQARTKDGCDVVAFIVFRIIGPQDLRNCPVVNPNKRHAHQQSRSGLVTMMQGQKLTVRQQCTCSSI